MPRGCHLERVAAGSTVSRSAVVRRPHSVDSGTAGTPWVMCVVVSLAKRANKPEWEIEHKREASCRLRVPPVLMGDCRHDLECSGSGQLVMHCALACLCAMQFQENDFPTLSGARIVRIATHPDATRMGYGSAALERLRQYFEVTQHAPLCRSMVMSCPPIDVHL